MPAVIERVTSTDRFVGAREDPLQIVEVVVTGLAPGGFTEVDAGAGAVWGVADADGRLEAEAPIRTGTAGAGTEIDVEVAVRADRDSASAVTAVTVAEPGWTVFLVPHFHYDPVWWNTQSGFLDEWLDLMPGADPGRFPGTALGFDLVRTHLRLARLDPDYKFVLAETDYLKPYWDRFPEERALIRRYLDDGRIELVGGTYNEPSTNLTGPESTIRNLAYGIGLQRDVLGGAPATAWQLDVFGHDPQFPGMLADAGLTSSSWARGPFHPWGPMQTTGHSGFTPPDAMQFTSEFDWISPSGRGVLTSYMAAHYSAGWWMDSAPTLADAETAVYELFRMMKRISATKNVMVPVGTDHIRPNKWVTEIHRDWNRRYAWPRFICALPRDYLDAVRATGVTLSAQTRDMNPVFTGKDVSYIDTKQAQRACETLLADAETLSTIASLTTGAAYPHESIDRAWRQLLYGAHHDAITGSESDQVYLDLLTSWRDAWTRASEIGEQAAGLLCEAGGAERVVTVINTLNWPRTDVVTFEAATPVRILDVAGDELPSVCDGPDGGPYAITFVAVDVPGIGRASYRLEQHDDAVGWQPIDGTAIGNGAYIVVADAARGGHLSSVVEVATGRELVAGGDVANEILVYDEYPEHPVTKLGPWQLLPTGGAPERSRDTAATCQAYSSPAGHRLVIRGQVGPVAYAQTVTLWHGLARIDCRTTVEHFTGADQLLRLRWPTPIEGALPVSEGADAVIGRGFAHPDVDAIETPSTLDSPALNWFGLGHTATIDIVGPDGDSRRAFGIVEIVTDGRPDGLRHARELAIALVRIGVTATTTTDSWPRYGSLVNDSNLPDLRIAVGSSAFAASVVASDNAAASEFDRQLRGNGRACVLVPSRQPLREAWVPQADLRDSRALPVLVIDGTDLDAEVRDVCGELADAHISVRHAVNLGAPEGFDDRSVAILNRGTPGFAVDTSGSLLLSLMRSCTGWPSGVWIDPPRRTVPDGSGFQLQHWTHDFDYAVVSGDGDWRANRTVFAGHEFNRPLRAVAGSGEPGETAYAALDPADAMIVTAVKAAGHPHADGTEPRQPADGVALRVYEPHGRAAEARLTLTGAPAEAVRADLLEVPLPGSEDGSLRLTPADIATYLVRPTDAARPVPIPAAARRDFARYWDHNDGPAPAGNLPLTVHIHAEPGDGIHVRITVAASGSATRQTGSVSITASDGWSVSAPTAGFDLDRNGWTEHRAIVTRTTAAGPCVLTATARAAGHEVVDVRVWSPDGIPLDRRGLCDHVESSWTTDAIVVRPGDRATATLRIANAGPFAIAGQAALLTPWGTWQWCRTWQRDLRIAARASDEIGFELDVPARARPWSGWALVKAAWYGAVHYSPTIPLEVRP